MEAQAKTWMKVGANVLLTHEDINISEQGAPSTVTPIKGLTIRSQGGVDYTGIYSMASSMPSYVPNNGMGAASKSYSEAYNLTITNTVN